MDLCREFIGLRVHHAQALRRHAVTSLEEMRFDVEHEQMRSRILRQLDLYLSAECPMVSVSKAHQTRSIVKPRRGTKDLQLDALRKAPVRTTHNRTTGVTSATDASGETRTYSPAPPGHTLWDGTKWVKP